MTALSFLVSAGHAEYLGGAHEPLVTVVWNPHEEDIWSGDDDPTSTSEKAEALCALRCPEALEVDADLTWETVVRVSGTRDAVEAWYRDLAGEVVGGPAGGDDDTFDYWPSGVRLALAVADHLGHDDDLRATLAATLASSGWAADELGLAL